MSAYDSPPDLVAIIRDLQARLSALERPKPNQERYKRIETAESTTSTSFVTLATADEITVDLATRGLIVIAFQALWKESVNGAARAAIYIDSTSLKLRSTGGSVADSPQPDINGAGGFTDRWTGLATHGGGLMSPGSNVDQVSDVETGQLVGLDRAIPGESVELSYDGGPCYVFASAGRHTVSIRFKASSGSVTAKERNLWVWTVAGPATVS